VTGALAGKNALVLGGSSGFGRAIAARFAEEGARVMIAARREDVLREVATDLGVAAHRCDIANDEDVRATVEACLRDLGGLDVAVNSAGFEQLTPLKHLEPDALKAMTDVQLHGAIYFLRHTAEAMAASGGGAIVSLSSLTAHRPAAGLTAYAASKRGVEFATEIAALEYGPRQVRVNCVAANLIETPMTAAMFTIPAVVEAFVSQTPLGRMGTTRDVEEAVLWLASDAAAFVTGQTLRVDGGGSLTRLPSPQDFAAAAARVAARVDE
jgi:NAD(P)-dependent dehydrogenase (short-subunit alcohol dehydrogenase family)